MKSIVSYTGYPTFYGYALDSRSYPRITKIVIVFHFTFSGDRQCPFGIQRPRQVLPVALAAAIARCDSIRCEDLRRQGSQHAQGECKGGEAAESRLLFHDNSLFLFVSLANTT